MGGYLKEIRKLVGSRRILLPGVRAIVVSRGGSVLLQRRTDTGQWGLPGGSVEPGETALEAVKREVAEETSLEVRRVEPMAFYSGPSQRFTYPNGDEIQCFSMAFIVSEWDGRPRPDGKEGSEVRFFPLTGLPENMHRIHRQTLRDYNEYDGVFLLGT